MFSSLAHFFVAHVAPSASSSEVSFQLDCNSVVACMTNSIFMNEHHIQNTSYVTAALKAHMGFRFRPWWGMEGCGIFVIDCEVS